MIIELLYLVMLFWLWIFISVMVVQRHEERVIIVSSKDSDSVFSDAENALHQIVSLILKVM